ncbi:MAG: glycosyltransferase family 39 protein [Thermomicrobiales bacterium]
MREGGYVKATDPGTTDLVTPPAAEPLPPVQRNHRLLGILALAVAGAGIVIGQKAFIQNGLSLVALGTYSLGALAVIGVAWPALSQWTTVVSARPSRSANFAPPLWLTIAGLASAAIAFGRSWWRGADQHAGDIAAFWVMGIALLTLAASWEILRTHGLGQSIFRTRRDTVRTSFLGAGSIALLILIVASLARFVLLDRFPTILDSDEGFFLLEARHAYHGEIPNAFTTNIFAMSNLWAQAQSWCAALFGESVATYRLPSALCGLISVVAVWRLGTRLFSVEVGLAAAGILALMPLNLWASRSGLNNITDAGSLMVALLFLDRAITRRSRLDALVCGFALGFGWHGYFGARVFIGIIVICAIVAALIPRSRLPFPTVLPLIGWIGMGTFAVAAPILGFYGRHPDIFMTRIRSISPSGQEGPNLLARLEKVPDALVYPFIDQVHGYAGGLDGGFYRFGPPFLGWTIAPLVAIGALVWLAWLVLNIVDRRLYQPRPALLLISWFIVAAGVAQTESMASQRQLALTGIWALAAGTGIVTIGQALKALAKIPSRTVNILLACAVTGIMGWNAQSYFSENQQVVNYGGTRNTTVWDLAWRLDQLAPPPSILLAGQPTLSYMGYGSWQYLNPGMKDKVIDLAPFQTLPSDAPLLASDQLLIVSSERNPSEVCAVQDRNPAAHAGEARDVHGTLLYTVFSTGDDLILPTATSPAESTLTPVETIPSCSEMPR